MIDLQILMPEIVLTIAMTVVFTVGLFMSNRSVLTAIGISAVLITIYLTITSQYGTAFNAMIRIDGMSSSFKVVCLIALALSLLISMSYNHIRDKNYPEYCSLLMLSTVGMMLMASANDVLIIYLSLELMSLCIYVLTGFNVRDVRSNEASIKYFLLGTFAGMLLLFSIALIYGITGTTEILKIAQYIKEKGLFANPMLLFALTLAASSFAFKIAAVPFHQWSPDAYEGAPTTVTAFMSVGPKAAAFSAFGRLFYEGFMPMQINWVEFLVIISILTMAVGNLLAMSQSNIKRMLAYSSIAHAGYMLVGFASLSKAGLEAVSFYMLIYAFMNIGAFAVVSHLEKGEELGSYRGLWHRKPLVAFSMLIFMASLTGLPPTAGFAGKLNLFMAAIDAGLVVPVIFAVIFSILSAFYYLRVVAYMFFVSESEEIHPLPTPVNLSVALFITTFSVCLIGIVPSVVI
ncbi:MAG: NADH-quinone oxidoreductase subunit N [Thermodesulfovibrionales bacterium]|nr:NADH-quinone oxidoreductase subunit N [Thermodesulfovibrionales bacterium]